MQQKPTYRTTRQQIWWSFFLGWSVILSIVFAGVLGSRQAVELAPTVVPSMIIMIAAMLGIHRGFGSLDFRAARDALSDMPSPPPYFARDKPVGPEGETP